MHPKKVLIVGCGYVGSALAELLLNSKAYEVYALRRRVEFLAEGLIPIAVDIQDTDSLKSKLPEKIDHIVYCLSAIDSSVASYDLAYYQGLKNILDFYTSEERQSNPEKITYISSTGVYADRQGGEVDEESPADTNSESSKRIIAGEDLLKSSFSNHLIIRFSGIYGPGREGLLNKLSLDEEIEVQKNPEIYTNRIHLHDCAAAIKFLMEQPVDGTFIASDDQPVSRYELYSWIRLKLGKKEPKEALSNGTNMVYGSKRCSNAKLKKLGYSFIYPSYKEGYGEMIRQKK